MINGIQQVGVGTTDVQKSFKWYRQNFGFNVAAFDEAAEAPLMTDYTGGKVHARHALFAVNLNGGGGMEIWSFTSRRSGDQHPFSLNRQGLLVTKIKCQNAKNCHPQINAKHTNPIEKDPTGKSAFSLIDPWGNPYIASESDHWFNQKDNEFGGIEGIVIGVKDMDKAIEFYGKVLGIDKVIFDETKVFDDLKHLKDGGETYRRVRIEPSNRHTGAFSEVFGHYHIELLEVKSTEKGGHNMDGRYWGDQGFIHLCFDVNQMDQIKKRAEELKHPFTVDSGDSFSMGEAAGRFAYVEDPDGTLIELVEADKITVSKKFGWKLTLSPAQKKKPLPRFLFWFMGLNKVKD